MTKKKPETHEGPFAAVLVKADGDYYLKLTDDNTLAWFPTVEEGLASFTHQFDGHHARSYEGSMSACIHYIYFQYALVPFESVDTMKKALISSDPPEVTQLSHVSGWMTGIKADRKKAAPIWEKAKKPALISR